MATLVRFYKEGDSILAVFPQLKYFPRISNNVFCYSHIGQHSATSPEYINELNEATEEEYRDLYEELVSIGYDLRICKPKKKRQ